MRSITQIVKNFKTNRAHQSNADALRQACRDPGMQWIESLLKPATALRLFFLQVLHGSTACQHSTHFDGRTFAAAAYCKARSRIALAAMELMLLRCVGEIREDALDTDRGFCSFA